MSDTHHDNAGHDDHGHEPHAVPLWVLGSVFGALFFLTIITWAVAKVDLGEFNLPVALLIAVVKVSLVALFFMHLFWDSLFNALALIGAFAFVALFIGLSMVDTHQYKPAIERWEQANPDVRDPAKKNAGSQGGADVDQQPAEGEAAPAASAPAVKLDAFAGSAYSPHAVLVPTV